jgi:hypothetical protein
MTWRAFAVLVVSVSACRDLSLPELSTLSVQADLNVVAPRQKMHLTASGGAG